MKVLVLGGTRFIGRRAVERLRLRGHALTLVHRGLQDPAGVDGVEHVHGDRAELAHLLPTGAWDVLLDCCAVRPAHVDAARAALTGRVGRIVQIGSMSVYARWGPEPLTEDFPRQSCSAEEAEGTTMDTYCQRKAECERRGDAWASADGVPFAVAHLGVVIGRGDYTDRVDRWVRDARAGGVYAAPYDLAPLVWVEDVAQALVAMVEGAGAGAYNLSLPGRRTLEEWLAALRAVVAPSFEVHPAEEVPGIQSDEPVTVCVDRAVRDLGFAPRPVEAALREIVGVAATG